MKIEFRLNGDMVEWDVSPGERFVDVLRRHGFMGTKYGCGTGECGACVILLNDNPVNSCLVLAPRVDGQAVTTIEGIGTIQEPHALQKAFAGHGAVQCGYCTPGMILSAYALLNRNPRPTPQEVCKALDGNLCRCTGYVKIIEAVLAAALALQGEAEV
jgi:aerobic-type carbon monoxide dehydrogenase small subunit (CoxS/CutS family)